MKTLIFQLSMVMLTILTLCQCGWKAEKQDLGDTVAVGLDRTPYVGRWLQEASATASDSDTIVVDYVRGVRLLADGTAESVNLRKNKYERWEVFEDSVLVLHGYSNKIAIRDTVTISAKKMTLPDGITIWHKTK